MQHDENFRLLDSGPERIELGEPERSRSLVTPSRRGSHEQDVRPVVEDEFELLDGLVRHSWGDDRCRVDTPFVYIRPLVQHPAVQGMDACRTQVRIVTHPFLNQTGKRWQHDRVVDPLLVHELKPRFGEAERRWAVDASADDLAVGLALW